MENLPKNSRLAPLVWEVSGLVQAVADALQTRFNPVTITGEISGWTPASSGHCYFTLKDTQAQVRCAMFRRSASLLSFRPKNGDKVEVRGRVDVYPARGELQVIVESMRVQGEGALMEQFLVLRDKLQRQGLFDPARKKSIPKRPAHIGVVTSLQAAAWQDVVTTLMRRAPHTPVTLIPASVQGERAVPELLRALALAAQRWEQLGECQVLLLVRGGGSMEDLWSFNDERLAIQLAQMPMPVICGVGHETDFTIADFVADLRAPTPTAAAELAAASIEDERQLVEALGDGVQRAMLRWTERQNQRLDRLMAGIRRPSAYLQQQRQRLQHLQGLQIRGLRAQWQSLHQRHAVNTSNWKRLETRVTADHRARLERMAMEWRQLSRQQFEVHRQRLERLDWQLQNMNPEQVLERGYAWLEDREGNVLTSVGQVRSGQEISATLSDGRLDLTVR